LPGENCTAKKYWWVLALAIITSIGFALRLYHLDLQCFARDEYFTLEAVPWDSVTIILWSLGGNYNPPLYYLFAHWSTVIFGGISNFSIRFPAAVFGTLCIPAGYFLGVEFRGKTLGFLMAAVISFLYPLIYYSQDGRAYTLVMLVFIGYIFFYIKIYRGDTSTNTIAYGSIFAALCLWSHFYSIFPLLVSVCILALKYRRIALLGSALVVLMCLPFLRYTTALVNHYYFLLGAAHNQGWLGPADVGILIPYTFFGWMGILIIPLSLFTIYRYKDWLHLSLIAIATLTVLSCFPMTIITSMSPRYALLVSPIVLLLGLFPLSEYIDSSNTITKKFALFVGVTFLLFLSNLYSLEMWYTINICPLMNLSLTPW
jgi:hypothetical protein